MNGPDYDPLAYDGRAPYRHQGGAHKPRNFDAMTAAYATGDPDAIKREVDIYANQLHEQGDTW